MDPGGPLIPLNHLLLTPAATAGSVVLVFDSIRISLHYLTPPTHIPSHKPNSADVRPVYGFSCGVVSGPKSCDLA